MCLEFSEYCFTERVHGDQICMIEWSLACVFSLSVGCG
jgi:hypothetical protein